MRVQGSTPSRNDALEAYRIHYADVSDFYVEHGRTENVPRVIGLDFEIRINFDGFVQIAWDDFFHAVTDHALREEVLLSLLVDANLSEIFL